MPNKMLNNFPVIEPIEVTLTADAPVMRALEILERSAARIALVVDDKQSIIGSLTDGDVRRGLIAGHTLQSPVKGVMHKNPYMLPLSTSRQRILEIMREQDIKQIPLVAENGECAGVALYDMLAGLSYPPRSNTVVIMAGGKGKRLMPLTSDRPKPMLTINGKPILEWIIQRFIHYGFTHFIVSLNYLGHVIEEYFGDGHSLGCHITYVREKEAMGTAGALSLIKTNFNEPLLVINGDILASVDFADVVDHHVASKSIATVCVRPHRTEVPYGVIQVKDGVLETIVEKPVYEDLVSAGIYVLNPEVLRCIIPNQTTDMPSVLHMLVQDKRRVSIFSMRDDWVDIGRPADLEKAKLALSDKAS